MCFAFNSQFTGPVPGGIPANTALRFLALHNNQLTGTVGESFGNLQTLEHLDLSNNQIRGYAINNNFGISSLTELTYLFLSANPFEAAEFPSWIQELTSLEELSLKSVKIAGTIPTWVGALSNLILLDLDDNDLRGSIPSELGNLTNLQFLLLNRNELTETVPAEITELRSLRTYSIRCPTVGHCYAFVVLIVSVDFLWCRLALLGKKCCNRKP